MSILGLRGKKLVIEWLAAMHQDAGKVPPAEATRRAEAAWVADPDKAAEQAANFAGLVEGMTGQRNIDPRRVGNWC